MAGICGVVGSAGYALDPLLDGLRYRGTEQSVRAEQPRLSLAGTFHPGRASEQPATADDGDVRIWVWGEVFGHGRGDTYVRRPGLAGESARFCANLYDTHGLEFATRLNGNYAIALHDSNDGTLTLITDRVGSHPIYYAEPGPDEFLFASNSQILAAHPTVDTAIDPEYLYEYLQLRRVFGTATPFEGLSELAPGSLTTIDLESLSRRTRRYWRPTYDPVDRPFSTVVDEFADTLVTILAEWLRDDQQYGLLLSGGSDSRAVQAAIDRPVTAFHIADWASREARVANRAAAAHGDEFVLLKRDDDYDLRALHRNPPLSNFSGWFDQGYFTGFAEEITGRVDALVSGLYADMLFADGPFATPQLSLGPLGNVPIPKRPRLDSVADYVAMQTGEAIEPFPAGRDDWSIDEIVRSNIRWTDSGIESHGVRYESLEDLVLYGDFVPMSADTDAIFSRSLHQLLPYRTPFLDNRMLELSQTVPMKYRITRDIVGQAVDQLDESLAAIPHARTGVAVGRPYAQSYFGGLVNQFRWKHFGTDDPPADHYDHKPWPDRAALLRSDERFGSVLTRNRDLLEAVPVVDSGSTRSCFQAHLEGADNSTVLYSILTVLGMPAIRSAAGLPPVTQPSQTERVTGDPVTGSEN